MDTKTRNQIRRTLEKVYDAGFMNDKFPTVEVDKLIDESILEIIAHVNEYVERRDSNK